MPKDHGGFPLRSPFTLPADIPVLAVAGGVIINAIHGTRTIPEFGPPALRGTEYDDYALQLQVSESVRVSYAHISALNPRLLSTVIAQPADERGRDVRIVVEAGDTLGWVGPHAAMDFSIADFSLDLHFLNPGRYPGTHIYSANNFDYFAEPVRSRILAITPRQLPPRGGKIDYDVEGRIVGNWFLLGTTEFTQWSRQLAIVYDHIVGDRITIADGSPMRDVPGIEGPGAPDVWWVTGNAPLPDSVGVGDGVVQHALIHRGLDDVTAITQGVLLVEMFAPGRIRVEVFKGVTEAEGFTGEARVYER